MKHATLLVAGFGAAAQAIQPGAAPAQPAKLRDLKFGDLNFLHTTDTHGWHAGHLLESSYSADWGDYIDFAHHLSRKLGEEGKDLLLIDTGDRIEGNGLYDASDPRGKYTFDIFKEQHIDLICSGNHELYQNASAEDDFSKLVPVYQNKYLASNLDILDPQTNNFTSMGSKYRYFKTTHQGIRIMAFGFLFDFFRNDENTRVTPVQQEIRTKWFAAAVNRMDVDLFIIIGHVGLRSYEFEAIYKAIRAVHKDTPVQFFGGHFHVRDYRIFDERAHALASGRYMETIGFQSISGISSTANDSSPSFFRRYIDNNLYSLYHHSATNAASFHTTRGRRATHDITAARAALHLDDTYGCTPQTYWINRVPASSSTSFFQVLINDISPAILNKDRADKSRMIIHNTGAIRFDVFKGRFTVDSTFIVSPFTSEMRYIADVPARLARRLLPILNGEDQQTEDLLGLNQSRSDGGLRIEDLLPPQQKAIFHYSSRSLSHASQHRNMNVQMAGVSDEPSQRWLNLETEINEYPLTSGYTTHDDLGDDGDDTVHSPIKYYNVPNVVQAFLPSPTRSTAFTTSQELECQLSRFYSCINDSPPGLVVESYNHSHTLSQRSQDLSAPKVGDDDKVDLIFNAFLQPYILTILNLLPSTYNNTGVEHLAEHGTASQKWFSLKTTQIDSDGSIDNERVALRRRREDRVAPAKYTSENVSNYLPGETFTSFLAKWVQQNWPCPEAKVGR